MAQRYDCYFQTWGLYSCSETLSEVEQYNSVVDVIKLKNQLEVFKHKELSFDELQVQTEVSSPAREEMKHFPCPSITGEYSATDKIKISFFMWKCRVSNSKYIFYLIYIFMKFPWFGQIFIQGSHSVKSKIFFSALHILDCFHKSELSPLTSLSSGCWSLITALLRMRPRVRNKRFMLDAEAPGVTRML